VNCIAAPTAILTCDPNTTQPTGPAFYITALPMPGSTQANDTSCAVFGVDSTGQQFAYTSAGAQNTTYCWSN
jgi:hypothetical protein